MLQRYLLELEGKLAGRLFSFSGGMAVAEIATMRSGDPGHETKRISSVKIEDMVLECGTGMSRTFYDWVGSIATASQMRMSGAVITLDTHSKPISRLEFYDALVASLELPELNKSRKDAVMTVSIKPEITKFERATGTQKLGVYTSALAKTWHVNGFRLAIDGIDCKHVTRVGPLKIGVTVKIAAPDASRGQLVRVGMNFSNFSLELPVAFSDGFLKWHKQSLYEGRTDQSKKGAIEFLAPNSSEVYFEVALEGLGIVAITQRAPSLLVELYYEGMTFKAGKGAIK